MATSVNIGGGDDQFNRYKMPPVIAKVEGRGNGIKTRIVNCFEVARALHRPPGYVCKFFGCELGAQTKIDDNTGVYIVNGAFQQNVLMDTLKKFIEMFVLCQSCNLPETDLKLRKNGNIYQACNACGNESPCDMTHKLCTYIINNPPDGKKKKSDRKKDKAARRAAKAKKANGEDEDEDKGRKVDRTSKKVAKKTVEEDVVPLGGEFEFVDDMAFAEAGLMPDDDDDVQWSVDTSKEAEEARMKELGGAASILERAPVEENRASAMKLRAYIDDGKKPSKVLSKAEKIFGEEDAIRGIMMAATDGETLGTVAASVRDRALPIFEYLGKPMGAEAQQAALEYMDWTGANDKNMVPVLPHILKLLFDEDVLEEEEIFKWYRMPNGREDVRGAVKAVVDWLENEDEEDSDSEEDESE